MKKKLLYFSSILTLGTFAQIPNGDFESWNVQNGIEVPQAPWMTNNLQTKPLGVSYNPVTKSTDHYPTSVGNYSIRMENNISYTSEPGEMMPYWACSYGYSTTAFYPGFNGTFFPINGHPTSLKGYYKFLPQNGDTMQIGISLYKNGVIVSENGFFSTDTVSSWTPFSIDLPTYIDADSAQVGMAAFYSEPFQLPAGPMGNSVLFVDNLSFDAFVLTTDELINNQTKIFPNPSKGEFVIESETGGILYLYNAVGELIKEYHINQKTNKLDLTSYTKGIYHLRFFNETGTSFQKLIIE